MTQQEKIPVIAVVGPTASGKSWLAVALAKWLDSEVVSADSMQIYREMTIGTAKPTAADMGGVVHHMVDFLPISQPFSVADYVAMAGDCLREIHSRGENSDSGGRHRTVCAVAPAKSGFLRREQG